MENIRDKRLIPANKRIGWIKSYPACSAPNLVDGELKRVVSQFANLLSEPRGSRVRQLVYGDIFRVLEENEGFSFGFNKFDGYVGYIQNDKLKKRSTKTTHWVSSLSTQIYEQPDIKKEYLSSLSFGSQLEIVNAEKEFCETIDGGFVPRQHLRKKEHFYSDPVMVAKFFLGVSYVWGGNTCWGIDCSGLIQTAFRACGIDLPADSDQQEAACIKISELNEIKRNDLMFWDGHVALVIDPNNLIHANAFHMSVTLESIKTVCKRIQFDRNDKFRLCRYEVG